MKYCDDPRNERTVVVVLLDDEHFSGEKTTVVGLVVSSNQGSTGRRPQAGDRVLFAKDCFDKIMRNANRRQEEYILEVEVCPNLDKSNPPWCSKWIYREIQNNSGKLQNQILVANRCHLEQTLAKYHLDTAPIVNLMNSLTKIYLQPSDDEIFAIQTQLEQENLVGEAARILELQLQLELTEEKRGIVEAAIKHAVGSESFLRMIHDNLKGIQGFPDFTEVRRLVG